MRKRKARNEMEGEEIKIEE